MFELITGGSGSGKSEYAEGRAVLLRGENEPLIYIAAMKPDGKAAKKRIERHRKLRAGKGFKTIEKYTDIRELSLPENATVLLECMSNLLANEIFDIGGCYAERIINGIERLRSDCKNLIVVTNEVFSDGIKYDEYTKEYIKALAKLNAQLAKSADRVTEVVYSIPVEVRSKC